MNFHKQLLSLVVLIVLINIVHAQKKAEKKDELTLTPGPITGSYNNNDLNDKYDESSIEIKCDGTKCTSSSNNVLLDKGKVTLTDAGTYVFGGKLNGQLNIAATEEDLIHLILKDATITSDFGPAIYAECKKLIITTEGKNSASDSKNYPKDATTDDDDDETKKKAPNACIFASNNLTLNGKGSLDVKGNFDEGIRSKNHLKIISGKINVVSKGNAIKGKESVSIKDGEITIDAGNTAIKATKDTKPDEGYVVIEGGNITIKAKQDGIHAETHLTVSGGKINVTECKEGLEAQMVDITGGDIVINNSNDGINAGRIGVSNAQGNTKKTFSDTNEQVYIRISGGQVDVRAEGSDLDGIDANGSLFFGGSATVFVDSVYGGVFGHMASVDSDGPKVLDVGLTALITATGKTSAKSSSTYDEPESKQCLQPYLYVKIDIQKEGTPITISDSKGNVLIKRTPRASYGIIFFTSPDLVDGEYTVTAGNITKTVKTQNDNPSKPKTTKTSSNKKTTTTKKTTSTKKTTTTKKITSTKKTTTTKKTTKTTKKITTTKKTTKTTKKITTTKKTTKTTKKSTKTTKKATKKTTRRRF